MVGQSLMEDESFRLDVGIKFSEFKISFFAIRSRGGVSNGEIDLSVPLYTIRNHVSSD